MTLFGFPLTIVLGIAALSSLLTTAVLGVMFHRFHKPVLKYHIFFAFLTVSIALIHAVLVILVYY